MSTTTPYFAVEQHFFFSVMETIVGRIYVDADWYLTNYKDIGDAVASGAVPSAAEHYRRFGFYEHRMPYEIKVDEKWYLENYPDLNKAIEAGHFPSGQIHFDTLGYREGRIPHAGFALKLVDA